MSAPLCVALLLLTAAAVVAIVLASRSFPERSSGNALVDEFIDGLFPDDWSGDIDLEAATAVNRARRESGKLGFELIRETDPDFDEQDFRNRVAWMFMKVHHALSDQRLDRIRDFTDDGALAHLQEHIDSKAREGWVQVYKGLRIESIQLVTSRQDGPEHRVVLHVVASAAACVIERTSGRLVMPDTFGDGLTRRRFTEAWTLSRDAATRSTAQPRLYRCPYCGGPIEEDHRYVCTYCHTDLRGPERDWTVRGIQFA